MKKSYPKILSTSLGLSALVCSLSSNLTAAPERFDVNGTTGASGVVANGSYTWEGAGYSSAAAGTDPVSWVDGNFLRLAAGTDAGASSYSITANANHTVAGMFLQSGGGGTVTINGPGVLSISSGDQGFLVNSASQTLIINAKLSGSGRLVNQLSGSLDLFGNNDFSGGILLSTSAGLNFNNNNSLGSGTVTWGVAQQVLSSTGSSAITLGNAMVTRAASQLIFTGPGAAPATFSGAWTLATGTSTISIGNNTQTTSKMAISGNMSGTGANLVVNSAATTASPNGNTLTISGTGNTYNGTTILGNGVAGGPRVVLGSANAIASTSKLTMNGSVLDLGGLGQSMTSSTFGLTANSSIDFESLGTLSLGNSSGNTWTVGTFLDLLNYTSGELRFGTDVTGLTAGQVGQIKVGGVANDVFIDSLGFIQVVPEPSTIALGLLGGVGMLWSIKRRRSV